MKEILTQIKAIAQETFSKPWNIEVIISVEKTTMEKIDILNVDLIHEITPLFFIHSLEHFYNETKSFVSFHFDLDNCKITTTKDGALRISFPIDEL